MASFSFFFADIEQVGGELAEFLRRFFHFLFGQFTIGDIGGGAHIAHDGPVRIPFRNGLADHPGRTAVGADKTVFGYGYLLVAGRCASMTHLGQSAARVSGACFVMGQAAGTAAAPSIARLTPPYSHAQAPCEGELSPRVLELGAMSV